MKPVYIHFRASRDIGLGHATRCLTLAQACLELGAAITLLIDDTTRELISSRLNPGFITQSFDPMDDVISLSNESILVVDNYNLDAAFERPYRKHIHALCVIDDLANRPHDCTHLLDQTVNCPPDKYFGLLPTECCCLLGSKYALINPAFASPRQDIPSVLPDKKKVVLTLGGSDPENVTGDILSLFPERSDIVNIDVVVGAANPHGLKLDEAAMSCKVPVRLHKGLNDLSTLFASCDLAIGAGGVSALERCANGLPGLFVEIADNQKDMIHALVQQGVGVSLGKPKDLTTHRLSEALDDMLQPEVHAQARSRARALCDGDGARRVAQILLQA